MKPKKTVPSPCISVCTINDETGFCLGCFRSLDEIAGWDAYEDDQRLKVLELLTKRHNTQDTYR